MTGLLTTLFQQECAAFFNSAHTPDLSVSHEQATGVLLDEHGVPYCTVARVSRFHILTARHCFFQSGRASFNAEAAFLNEPNRKWKVSRLNRKTAPPDIASLIQEDDRPFRNGRRYDPFDFDILELKTTVKKFSGDPISFASSDVRNGQMLRVLAHNNYVRAYLHIVQGSAPAWQNAMRFDTQNSCRAELFRYRNRRNNYNQACLIHGCQTSPSGSGAAVLRNGKIVAVHVGENGIRGCASALKFVGNRGVRKWERFERIKKAILADGKRHLR